VNFFKGINIFASLQSRREERANVLWSGTNFHSRRELGSR